jgi:hypothetical protein
MPHRGTVDQAFDGHLERPLLALSVSERLDWIWTGMRLLALGRAHREAQAARRATSTKTGVCP